jgi:H+/gluconate symporter-like permease
MFQTQTNLPGQGQPLLSAGITVDVPTNTILGLTIGIFLAIFLGHFLSNTLKN